MSSEKIRAMIRERSEGFFLALDEAGSEEEAKQITEKERRTIEAARNKENKQVKEMAKPTSKALAASLEQLREYQRRADALYRKFQKKANALEEYKRSFLCPTCRGAGGACESCRSSGRVLSCPRTDGDSIPCEICDGKGYKPYIFPKGIAQLNRVRT